MQAGGLISELTLCCLFIGVHSLVSSARSSYPLIIHPLTRLSSITTGGSKLPPKDYNGDRKKGPLVGWATSLVNEKVTKLRVPAQGGVSGADGIKEVDKYLAKVCPPSIPLSVAARNFIE